MASSPLLNSGAAAPTYRWIIAASGMLGIMAALGFGRFGYSMILPAMKDGLSITEARAGDLSTANMLGYLAFSLIGGLLASRFGSRRVIAASLVAVSAGMALTAMAPSYPWAFAARLVTGMAAGSVNVPVMGLLSSWFNPRERGLAGGMAVGGSSLGLIVAGLLVPVLLSRFGGSGWRASWFALSALALGIALLCAIVFRDRPIGADRAAGNPDSILAMDGAVARKASSSQLQDHPHVSEIFRRPLLWALGGIYACFGFSYIVYTTFFARALTAERGWEIVAAGRLWSAMGALSLASGFLWGGLSDRIGRTRGLAIVFLFQALSFGAFGLWRQEAGLWVSAALFALTAWSIPAIMAAAAGDILGARLAPGALGFLTLFMGAGQVLGPLVAGRMAQAMGSYAGAFALAAGLALAGGAACLLVGRRR